jgi:ADP-ribose pyrophosphatase
MNQQRDVEIIAETDHLRLVRRHGWEYVERKDICGIVAIVAVTSRGELLLVEQYRPPVDGCVIELPAGLAGDVLGEEEESLETAARRELLEETGYQAQKMVHLFHGPPSAGITSEELTFFLAEGLELVAAGGGDASEDITVHAVPLDRLAGWLKEQARLGKRIDVKVYAGLHAIGDQRGEAPPR